MRRIAVLLLALGACRSLNESDPTTYSAPHQRTITETATGTTESRMFVELATDYHAPTTRLTVLPARAWPELVRVYQQVGLPITRYDTAQRHVASVGWHLSHQLNGKPMSWWLDCGRGAGGIPRADRAEITGTLESIVGVADDGATMLLTSLRARAGDESGGSSNPVPCTSTGALESWIAQQVSTRAGGS